MNCANHPTAEAAGYCQQCGKPLCTECARPVGGTIFCEPCLQARLGIPAGGQAPGMFPEAHPNPAFAGLLGFIPGVGAMYNGQFAKALAHVLIFAVFVSLADKSLIFSMLAFAWVFYQVFDAHQTAKARRDGLPLPNPFGLNDLGSRVGISQTPTSAAPAGTSGFSSAAPPQAGAKLAAQQGETPYAASPAYGPPPASVRSPLSRTPVGAIVLIVIGLLLLFRTLDILSEEWISRGWPLVILGWGAWLLFRRMHETPPEGPQ